ncbi:MAG: cytochrome c biogenesis protein CcsA [Bacteroidota bacterium]
MVIHPPTLFLGFALTLFPFAFCLAGLWDKKYSEWIKPALPWTVLAGAVLGLGILMGGIWAYETLNFGGYWNWDPVENAVYVPWLVLDRFDAHDDHLQEQQHRS